MMSWLRRCALILCALAFLALPAASMANDAVDSLCKGAGVGQSNQCKTDSSGKVVDSKGKAYDSGLAKKVGDISNTLMYITGAIAVIVIIIGAVRYVTSQGNEASVKAAKDTILYAIIGLIIAILAYAIVNFTVGAVT